MNLAMCHHKYKLNSIHLQDSIITNRTKITIKSTIMSVHIPNLQPYQCEPVLDSTAVKIPSATLILKFISTIWR